MFFSKVLDDKYSETYKFEGLACIWNWIDPIHKQVLGRIDFVTNYISLGFRLSIPLAFD